MLLQIPNSCRFSTQLWFGREISEVFFYNKDAKSVLMDI